jgi:preprotein translocase subunit YajC
VIAVIYLLVLVVAFYFVFVRPQRRRMAEHQALMTRLKVGDQVVTTAGIYATVRDLTDDTVALELSPGVVVTFARGAVSKINTPAPEAPDDAGSGEPAED